MGVVMETRASAGDESKELQIEQDYFDAALECRERQRRNLGQAAEGAVHKGDARALRRAADSAIENLRGPDEAVAFGRTEAEDSQRTYVGYNAIFDTERDVLVVSWKAEAAHPFYEATYESPLGMRSRRTFLCDGNQILDFEDVLFKELAADVASLMAEPKMDDALLAELARTRTGEMQDIVRTIQAAQYEILRADLDQLLIVQGGPGTGKTVVALHRVAWLLYNYRDRLQAENVLVIGPNRTFVRYIRSVLPSLGDENVKHAEFESLLGVGVPQGREEDDQLVKLKGQLRMSGLVEQGLQQRVGLPNDDVSLRIGSRTITFDRDVLAEQVEALRSRPYGSGRQRLREFMRTFATEQGGQAPAADTLDNAVDRVWPQMTAASFLQELFGSEGRLIGAAGDNFSAAEVRMLYRRAAERLAEESWSKADVPLLDHADYMIRGEAPSAYDHIILDEAQDLSPMQLLMIARRSTNGSMTVLGDIAQSTGPWARDSWDDVVELLATEAPTRHEELRFGYRVPRQIFEVAARVLEVAAPHVRAPRIIRDGPSSPKFVAVDADGRASAVVNAARDYAGSGYLVGIITPTSLRESLREALDAHEVLWTDARRGELGTITLLTAAEAKGLEFDAVVVVEPERIVSEDPNGYRLLYVALTRTIRHLSIVHAGIALPEGEPESETPPRSIPQARAEGEAGTSATLLAPLTGALAEEIAAQIKGLVRKEQWDVLLGEISEHLRNGGAD